MCMQKCSISKGGSNSAVGVSSSEQQKLEGQFQKVLQKKKYKLNNALGNPQIKKTKAETFLE